MSAPIMVITAIVLLVAPLLMGFLTLTRAGSDQTCHQEQTVILPTQALVPVSIAKEESAPTIKLGALALLLHYIQYKRSIPGGTWHDAMAHLGNTLLAPVRIQEERGVLPQQAWSLQDNEAPTQHLDPLLPSQNAARGTQATGGEEEVTIKTLVQRNMQEAFTQRLIALTRVVAEQYTHKGSFKRDKFTYSSTAASAHERAHKLSRVEWELLMRDPEGWFRLSGMIIKEVDPENGNEVDVFVGGWNDLSQWVKGNWDSIRKQVQ